MLLTNLIKGIRKGLAQTFDSGLTEEVRALFYDCIKEESCHMKKYRS